MKVTKVQNEQQLKDAHSVRFKVFVKEQEVPQEIEVDQFDETSTHFVVYDDFKPIGAGRLRDLNGVGKVERICVDASFRDMGIGKLLMKFIEDEAKKMGFTTIKLNSQIQASDFYHSLGYEVCSQEFFDAGILHVTMKKSL
jgi:predicted GNAT family N-acyltransferase